MGCSPIRMNTTAERRALRRLVNNIAKTGKGLYVLFKEEKALYVGRTDQIADRLLGHGTKPNANAQSAATFARILAKHHFKAEVNSRYDLFSLDLNREFNKNPDVKMRLWNDAVAEVKNMTTRVVEVEHPHEQVVFEVYVHEKLKTPFNSFVNH